MDTYRDDYTALREQVDALKRELDETKQELEQAHGQADAHKKTAHTFETELMRMKRVSPQRSWTVTIGAAVFLGAVLGLLVESGISSRRLREVQALAASQVSECRDDVLRCTLRCR
jgi:hypothetical protein